MSLYVILSLYVTFSLFYPSTNLISICSQTCVMFFVFIVKLMPQQKTFTYNSGFATQSVNSCNVLSDMYHKLRKRYIWRNEDKRR